jgi:heat-inducible transcriptional repressor
MNQQKSKQYPELNPRELSVFKSIMEHYTLEAEPVGSRKLARDFRLSPATLRNIVADLEDYGLLEQPHISAGRIPSDMGYRYYVDKLVEKKNLSLIKPDFEKIIKESIAFRSQMENILQQVSNILSKLTNCTGLVVAPKISSAYYRQMQFIRLSSNRILAIFITQSGVVHNRIIITDNDYSPEMLDQISKMLSDRFANYSLEQIRTELLRLYEEEKIKYDSMLDAASRLCEIAAKNDLTADQQLFIEGTTNIFSHPEFKNISKLKEVFNAFNEKNAMIRLLDKCLDNDGVFVEIGNEIENKDLNDISVVSSKYSAGKSAAGSLGIIGPRRMPYQLIVSLVEYVSDLLSFTLQNLEDPDKLELNSSDRAD